MWKKLLLASTLLLGGCAGTAVTVQTIESEIQQATASLCGFVPTLETIDAVAAVVTGGLPGVSAVLALVGTGLATVETDICSAVPPPASAARARLPHLGSPYAGRAGVLHYATGHGIPINGWTVH